MEAAMKPTKLATDPPKDVREQIDKLKASHLHDAVVPLLEGLLSRLEAVEAGQEQARHGVTF